MVYIIGGGGVGKTQLAKQYSYIHIKEYDLIWWFDSRRDLTIQYEDLLAHLKKSNKFRDMFPADIKSIAPNMLVDLINSLLAKLNYNWLLVFDNLPGNDHIIFPQTHKSKHHIIITTKEKQNFGGDILILDPFTDQESEEFLLKLLPKEKKEDIRKLCKILGNYPLGLAQVSEEIIISNQNICAYLKKYNKSKMKDDHGVFLQATDHYHEFLDRTICKIEKEDKEAAKLFYMLVLLGLDFKQGLLMDLFGGKIETQIDKLKKYGLVQTIMEQNFTKLNIHDVVKDYAIKELNKKVAYKLEIIRDLETGFKNFYSPKSLYHLYKQEQLKNHITILNSFLNIELQNDTLNEVVIDAIITLFRSNSMLFNSYANYDMYEQLASEVYNKSLEKNIPPVKKALLYTNLIISSYVLESNEKALKLEKEILELIKLIDITNNQGELFVIYSYLSLYYLFLGDFNESKKYIEIAYRYIDFVDDTFSLLRFWFTKAWLCYELRDVKVGMNAINSFEKHNCSILSPTGNLFIRDLKIKFDILKGQRNKAIQEIEKAIKDAKKYSNNTPSCVWGELEYTKVLIYSTYFNHIQTEKQGIQALKVLANAYGGDFVDLTQAHIHVILGKIYEDRKNYNRCLEEYLAAYKVYNKRFHGRINNFYEYGELLANLCFFYYKQNNLLESKFYFHKLVANFDLDHVIVEKLIKKLSPQYIYLIDKLGHTKAVAV